MYYELCDLMYQILFEVPDEITDMTRSPEMVETYRLIYLKVVFGHRNGFGKVQTFSGVPGVPVTPRYSGIYLITPETYSGVRI